MAEVNSKMASDTSKILFHSWALSGRKFSRLVDDSRFRVTVSLGAFKLSHCCFPIHNSGSLDLPPLLRQLGYLYGFIAFSSGVLDFTTNAIHRSIWLICLWVPFRHVA